AGAGPAVLFALGSGVEGVEAGVSAMALDRRAFLGPALTAAAPPRRGAGRLGIVIHSYGIRSRQRGFADPIGFVEFCRERGAGGVQLPLGDRDAAYIKRLRAAVEKAGMYLEGSLRTPRDRADRDRFEAEVRTA